MISFRSSERKKGGDAGYTVVELALSMLIASLITSTVLGYLVSQTNAERRIQAVAANQQSLRLALIEVSRDVRAADPLMPLPGGMDYKTALQVTLRDVGTAPDRIVRWRVDSASSSLVREEIDTNGNVTGQSYKLAGVAATQTFSYYRGDGTGYVLDGTDDASVASCAIRVHIGLTAAPNPGPSAQTVEADVELRNRVPLPNDPWCAAAP